MNAAHPSLRLLLCTVCVCVCAWLSPAAASMSDSPRWPSEPGRCPGALLVSSDRTRGGYDGGSGVDITYQETPVVTGSSYGSGFQLELFLVTFAFKLTAEDKSRFAEAVGCHLGRYIPHRSFIFVGTATAARRAAVLTNPLVTWVGAVPDSAKLSPGSVLAATQHLCHDDGARSVTPIQFNLLVAGPRSASALESSLQQFWQRRFGDDNHLTAMITAVSPRKLTLSLTNRDQTSMDCTREVTSVLRELSGVPLVEWVEVKPVFRSLNNAARAITHEGVRADPASESPIWARGLTGSGQIVSVGDSGLDANALFFKDAAVPIPYDRVDTKHRKIVSYVTTFGDKGDWGGHGSHVAGTVAGNFANSSKTVKVAIAGELQKYDGMAPGAKLQMVDLAKGDSDALTPPEDLNADYFPLAHGIGARISTNSWGEPSSLYSASTQEIDLFSHEHADFLIIFSAGNYGDCGSGSIGGNASAKNALVVGSSQTLTTSFGSGPHDLSRFSSRGPTADGRIKPDLVAPGDNIYSSRPGKFDDKCPSLLACVRGLSGTSMSAAVVAGNAAILREYFSRGFYPTGKEVAKDNMTPTSALLKAVLVQSADLLDGHIGSSDVSGKKPSPLGKSPSGDQGFGRMLLKNVMRFVDESEKNAAVNLYVDQDSTVSTDTAIRYKVTLPASGPIDLRATLVWTDPPSSPLAAENLVNNLDLVLQCGDVVVLGNSFLGHADRLNNVERATLAMADAPLPDSCVLSVHGVDVPSDDLGQRFAVVMTGTFASVEDHPSVEDSQDVKCLNDCSGHGYCQHPAGAAQSTCLCDRGFSGVDCSADTCPLHCSGNGECVSGSCHCNEGFAGEGCRYRYSDELTTDGEPLTGQHGSSYTWSYFRVAPSKRKTAVHVTIDARSSTTMLKHVQIQTGEAPTKVTNPSELFRSSFTGEVTADKGETVWIGVYFPAPQTIGGILKCDGAFSLSATAEELDDGKKGTNKQLLLKVVSAVFAFLLVAMVATLVAIAVVWWTRGFKTRRDASKVDAEGGEERNWYTSIDDAEGNASSGTSVDGNMSPYRPPQPPQRQHSNTSWIGDV